MDKHDTIGIDCVAMCVNDVACAGGEPLFFLDYIACGKNYPEKIAAIVSGVAAVSYTHLSNRMREKRHLSGKGKRRLKYGIFLVLRWKGVHINLSLIHI